MAITSNMNLRDLLAFLSFVVVSVTGQCSHNQTNVVRKQFKDCMDERQAALLKINTEDEDNNIKVYCDGLVEFSSGCSDAIDSFSKCKTRDEVNNLVAIHINSIAELLTRPGLDLKSCPAFQTTKAPPSIELT